MARNERWRRFRKSNRTWDSPWLPATGGLVAGALATLTVAGLESTAMGLTAFGGGSWAPFWAFWLGFIGLALPLLAIQYGIARVHREVRALVNIRPFTGSRLLATDAWAMDAVFAEQVLSLVDEGHDQIVECGSGHSTVLIAERLEERGSGHVTAIEHLEEFADRTRTWLEDRGLTHRATIIHAPIERRDVEGNGMPWYAAAALESLPDRIDLLIVDGPPDKLGSMARWPAVPLLEDRLAPDAVILMDDGDRKDERRTAFGWKERLGARMAYIPGGKGGWLLRLPG